MLRSDDGLDWCVRLTWATHRGGKALSATLSPPNGCKTSRLTCAASRRWHGLCRHLSACWSRNCNRIFVSCCTMHDTAYLYDALGRRLYLTPGEGEAFLRTALGHDRPVRTFCSVLYYTGCRISEALHLTPRRVDFADQVIVVESLKNAAEAYTASSRYPSPCWI